MGLLQDVNVQQLTVFGVQDPTHHGTVQCGLAAVEKEVLSHIGHQLLGILIPGPGIVREHPYPITAAGAEAAGEVVAG